MFCGILPVLNLSLWGDSLKVLNLSNILLQWDKETCLVYAGCYGWQSEPCDDGVKNKKNLSKRGFFFISEDNYLTSTYLNLEASGTWQAPFSRLLNHIHLFRSV